MTDDRPMPTTTKEFAAYLRALADQVDRIPDAPITMHEHDAEIGFYYGNPAFPQLPTGIHVQFTASTHGAGLDVPAACMRDRHNSCAGTRT